MNINMNKNPLENQGQIHIDFDQQERHKVALNNYIYIEDENRMQKKDGIWYIDDKTVAEYKKERLDKLYNDGPSDNQELYKHYKH